MKNEHILATAIAAVQSLIERAEKRLNKRIDETLTEQVEIEGPQGPRGSKGDNGERGPQGEMGPVGPKGETGPQGPKGEDGKDGKDGRDGIDGSEGPQGERGDTGPRGLPGEKGDRGDVGPRGPQGVPGVAGQRGLAGPAGKNGERGERGLQGEQGPQGETGPAGVPGKEGPEGRRGPKGDKGDKGDPGKDGKQGPPGLQGPAGKDGEDADLEPFKRQIDEFVSIQRRNVEAAIRRVVAAGSHASTSGGGSVNILDNDDVVFSKPEQLANNDILIFQQDIQKFSAINIVDVINNIKVELEMQFDKLVDEQVIDENTTYTYIGESSPGSSKSNAVWRIKRVAEYANGSIEILWANDTANLDKIWNSRTTYSYDV